MKFNIDKEKLVSRPVFDVNLIPAHAINSFQLFKRSLVSDALTREVVDVNQVSIQCISSDIDLLIRMSQGAKLDSALAEELLSRMSANVSDEISDILDQMSDDELLEGVRSKYIQTPAQLEEYIRSLDSRLESLSSQEIEDVVENVDVQPKSVEPIAETSSD